MDIKDELNEIYNKLKQERDELRVKANLLQKEARDEWEKVDHRFEEFRSKVNHLGEAGEKAGSDVYSALKLVGGEIKAGFERIRRSL